MTAEKPTIHIVGAGLAGSECALQLAALGYSVVLIEMRDGEISTPAHKTNQCAELVCSNSFGSLAGHSAPGELKWEAELLGSRILEAAFEARVPAGQALGMDRDVFARAVTRMIEENPRIRLERRAVKSLDELPRPCVVATGPLTGDDLAHSMQEHFGDEFLYFFDAIAPIIATDSVNMNVAWRADRWDKGTKDYINCPMSRKEYLFFIDELKAARKTEPKDFEKNTPYFESCMPIEAMVERGEQTPRFGPMSAKGLKDPRTGNNPFAVVQLRQDNKEGTAYNMVGFQTKMAYADQKRVFRLIPGLEEAEFLKLGSIHRNLYINTPKRLNRDLSSKKDPLLFFAGQITGVEGYFESTCMGLLVARFLDQKVRGVATNFPPRATALGSLIEAITDETKVDHFQPTNINFGHMPSIPELAPEPGQRFKKIDKNAKREMQIANARSAMREWLTASGVAFPNSGTVSDTVSGAAPGNSSRVEDAARALAEISAAASAAQDAVL
ncbi:MAG: methylenetetrahydrofolate--tRNA-(uracil(54)-C(5))-methyltransferase (FADH(2)-oxidizing) TrmFO [Bdellovibrionota bacterium]